MKKEIATVYIVDDDPIIVYAMKRLMKEMNFYNNLHVFENGKVALDALLKAKKTGVNLPNLIFLDLAMPIMNAWEFLHEFSKIDFGKNSHSIRIVAISSSVNPSDIEKINSYSSVERYIVKPITPSDLLNLLDN